MYPDAPTAEGSVDAPQKAGNRRVSRRRIAVEHGIGKMKVWHIAAEPVSRHRTGASVAFVGRSR